MRFVRVKRALHLQTLCDLFGVRKSLELLLFEAYLVLLLACTFAAAAAHQFPSNLLLRGTLQSWCRLLLHLLLLLFDDLVEVVHLRIVCMFDHIPHVAIRLRLRLLAHVALKVAWYIHLRTDHGVRDEVVRSLRIELIVQADYVSCKDVSEGIVLLQLILLLPLIESFVEPFHLLHQAKLLQASHSFGPAHLVRLRFIDLSELRWQLTCRYRELIISRWNLLLVLFLHVFLFYE